MKPLRDPVECRASAMAVAKLSVTLVSDVAMAADSRTYRDCAQRQIDAIRRELATLERELRGEPERIERAPIDFGRIADLHAGA